MTLAKRVIPCLDVTGGRVVKGVVFVDLRDAGDPAELAARYDQDGADEIVFLDITASSDERAILLDVVRRTADRVFIPLTVGGGVRSIKDIDALLRAGADKVSLNTAALERPALIDEAAATFGSQCVAKAAMRFDEAGVDTQRFAQLNDGSIHIALQTECEAELPMCLGEVRVETQRFAQFNNGLVEFAFHSEDRPQVSVRQREIWLQTYRFLVFCNGAVEIAFHL